MSLSDRGGKVPVPADLIRAEMPESGLSTMRVVMLKDGHGITGHGRRPEEIRPSKGDTLEVSSDLALNWAEAGYCELAQASEPGAPQGDAVVARDPDPINEREPPSVTPGGHPKTNRKRRVRRE